MSDAAPDAIEARRTAFPPNWGFRIGLVAVVLYTAYASSILELTGERFIQGLGHGARFLARMFPPNVAADRMQLLIHGMAESLQIAILATAVGVAFSLVLGLSAARNLTP